MKSFIAAGIIVLAVSMTMMFTACDTKGPAEKAGEKIDQTVEKTTATLKDAGEKIEAGLKQ